MRPVIIVISEVSFAPTFEWLSRLHAEGRVRLEFVLMNEGGSSLESNLLAKGVPVTRITYRGKRDSLSATWKLFRHFRARSPGVVHTHMLAASLCGLVAAFVARVSNRIYTRHHSNLNQEGPRRGRMYDRLCNALSGRIVATCENVRTYLEAVERVPAHKVTTIPFGFPLEHFAVASQDRLEKLRERHGYAGRFPVIGVVSRFIPCKSVPLIVESFRITLARYPNACLVLANAGSGSDRARVLALLGELPDSAYRMVRFEEDGPALLQSFDVFVHAPADPVSEAFGQVYVEALLCGVPSVFTLSGVAREFVRHERNALVVPFSSAAGIAASVERILEDGVLANGLKQRGREDAERLFQLSHMIESFEELYRCGN